MLLYCDYGNKFDSLLIRSYRLCKGHKTREPFIHIYYYDNYFNVQELIIYRKDVLLILKRSSQIFYGNISEKCVFDATERMI